MEKETQNKPIKVYFAGIDYWNRPVFRAVFKKCAYYCDVVHLVDYGTTNEEKLLEYYNTVGTAGIIYKGTSFEAEPAGDHVEVELVTRKEAYEMVKEQEGGQS